MSELQTEIVVIFERYQSTTFLEDDEEVPGYEHQVLLEEEGKVVTFKSGGPTDEGYSYSQEQFSYEDTPDGLYLYSTRENSSRDCDGRMDSDSSSRVKLKFISHLPTKFRVDDSTGERTVQILTELWMPVEEGKLIAWERLDSSQRDYEAERMGY